MHNAGTTSYTDKADTKVVKFLFPYLWPKGERKIKVRVVISILAVILSKVVAVFVPFFYNSH